jgi:hypothetical protein
MRISILIVCVGTTLISAQALGGENMRTACAALPAMVSSSLPDFFSAIRTCAKEPQGSAAFYEIAGTRHGSERRALFDASGALIGLDETIEIGALPAPILAVMADRYAGLPILRVRKMRRATSVFYEIRIEKDGKEQAIFFNGLGMWKA